MVTCLGTGLKNNRYILLTNIYDLVAFLIVASMWQHVKVFNPYLFLLTNIKEYFFIHRSWRSRINCKNLVHNEHGRLGNRSKGSQ